MSDFVEPVKGKTDLIDARTMAPKPDELESNMPTYASLQDQLSEASSLVDDIILKNYLTRLTDLEIVPLDDSLKRIGDIRLFKINEMVYQNKEYSTYKFASVFNSVQNLNCGIFIIADSDGNKTNFYMGVRSFDDKRTTKSLKETLRNALCGQFPGVKMEDLLDPDAEKYLATIPAKNIASVSCVAQNKDEEFNDNERFIQGLEKLALAMQGQRYTAVILAKSTPSEQLADIRGAYETIYTHLSPFARLVLSYGKNKVLSVSDAFSSGTTAGTSHSYSSSTQIGKSHSKGTSTSESVTKHDNKAMLAKGVGTALLGVASIVTAPLTGGASLVAAGAIMAGRMALDSITPNSTNRGTSTSENYTDSISETVGESDTISESSSENKTQTVGLSSGKTNNIQLTMQNKTLINILERIDLQLKRIDECESIGMWECAAYFLSERQETAEMAAGTYKALMKGEKSGVETSAINFWGRMEPQKLPLLREYITNFVHPVFAYSSSLAVPVTAASLVSGNELAIQMGLPRKSVCGFPVIEHADFGKEARYGDNSFKLGKVFSMGRENDTEVRLDRDSLTMHTFITGSTGSGKSNTVYEILKQAGVPFLVIEPAKGEYKNIFGQFPDVAVYGTNPKKTCLLQINPFSFPPEIHVLEHLDRLVEIFNVCWPMYAAMPAILKEAMEKAYVEAGWDISTSVNLKGEVYPNFTDLLEQIEIVIGESKYSADTKGDYSGALLTRIRSLTNGLNRLIFCGDESSDEDLFDKKVIVDLSRVGSTETKSLIMGLLVLKLNEYRMTSGNINSPLTHITVLEEAHNLLKRTSTEQVAESSNLIGKSVEMLANSIAEMRTYGEGFVIADQSPGLLDLSVIRNTNTKIILRLPELSDRELVGYAAGLDKDQITELSKLEGGVAAIYQNNWAEPVLVKINKCAICEKRFNAESNLVLTDVQNIRQQLVCLLIQGRIRERLDFDIDDIERNLHALALSSRHREFVEEQIAEYRADGKLSIWDEENFIELSQRLADFLGIRTRVENIVLTATDDMELTEKLAEVVKSFVQSPSEQLTFSLSQCFMKDLSIGQDESERREKIYKQWIDTVKERSAKI